MKPQAILRTTMILAVTIFWGTCIANLASGAEPSGKGKKAATATLNSDHKKDTDRNDASDFRSQLKPLVQAGTKYLNKLSEPNKMTDVVDHTDKIVGILTSVVALIASIIAFFKTDAFSKYKFLLITAAIISLSLLLLFLFSDLLRTLALMIAAISVTVFLLLYILLKYIEHIEKQGYDLTGPMVIRIFNGQVIKKRKEPEFNGYNVLEDIYNVLEYIRFWQIRYNRMEIELKGSFAYGFDTTICTILPNTTGTAKYLYMDEQMVIPQNIKVECFSKSPAKKLTIVNIQKGGLIVANDEKGRLMTNGFSEDGLKKLNNSTTDWYTDEYLKQINKTETHPPSESAK